MSSPDQSATVAASVHKTSVVERSGAERDDLVAVEEPLEIRVASELEGRRSRDPVAITMRTPGHDFELAAGFLYSEAVVTDRPSIWRVAYCETPEQQESEGNIVEVHLAPGTAFDRSRASRQVYTTSSCGVCGRGSLELLWTAQPERPEGDELALTAEMLCELPARLEAAQAVFGQTGGLHAAAVCTAEGELELLREDVGRHNAVDKLVGRLLLDDALPGSNRLLLVSGRASFELVQKAVMAGIPALAAVGAPSSLAISAAERFGLTLIGFLSESRYNVYTGRERVES